MSGEYSTPRWKRLRATFKADCRARNAPCCHCHQPINYGLGGNHPDGFTAEHVVPRSVNPALFWRLDNLAPAHMRCNSHRQVTPMAGPGEWTRPTW
ncbi:MAG: HNH endonuclease [Mycobacterium sp.]|uniref:HNH endonuclease n=1 Tax=Mycobacterium sp. TaxID=1785 RepID=UPI003F9552CD